MCADSNSFASFMHFALILSPKGQYLLKLVGNANRLVPYTVIRQTLKIGNVATMISAMMRVILAKISVSTITNWIGLTSGEDQGMNLMQQYVFCTSLQCHSDVLQNHFNGLELGQPRSRKSCFQNRKRQDIILKQGAASMSQRICEHVSRRTRTATTSKQ